MADRPDHRVRHARSDHPLKDTVTRPRLAVLISGRGSNLGALLAATRRGDLSADICVVISSHADAAGLSLGRNFAIESLTLDYREFKSREAFDAALNQALREKTPDLVVLAGFMRILSAPFVQRWHTRLINIHPSLLPRHAGLKTHQRAIDAGDRVHGATVHLVSERVDAGSILGLASLMVHPEDDPARLASRVLTLEHRLYPAVLKALVEGAFIGREGLILERLLPELPLVRLHE